MILKTNYKEMTDRQLLSELSRRLDAFGDSLSTYVSGLVKIKYKRKIVYFGEINHSDLSFTILPYEGYHEFVETDLSNGRVIQENTPEYRELLILFLQAPFTTFIYSEERPEESQESYFEDYEDLDEEDNNF